MEVDSVDMTLSFCENDFYDAEKTTSNFLNDDTFKLNKTCFQQERKHATQKQHNPTKKRLDSMTIVTGFFHSVMPSSNHHPPTSNFHLGGTSPSQEKASKMFHHPQFVTPRKINGWNPKTWRIGSDDVPFQLRVIFR